MLEELPEKHTFELEDQISLQINWLLNCLKTPKIHPNHNTHQVLPGMLLIPTSQIVLFHKCPLSCPASEKQRRGSECSHVTSSTQPPFSSPNPQITVTTSHSSNPWMPTCWGITYTHYLIELYNNPAVKKLLSLFYDGEKWSSKRMRNGLTELLLMWNS